MLPENLVFVIIMIDIALISKSTCLVHPHIALLSGCRAVSENDFRDELVLQIIAKYGRSTSLEAKPGEPTDSEGIVALCPTPKDAVSTAN